MKKSITIQLNIVDKQRMPIKLKLDVKPTVISVVVNILAALQCL